ncbi:DUF4232 domain-containing protein [Streptomyces boninensis]|uniref:DUF4232 domain-containing protein n=1 Tax=Streptomyces boninensis TaxID=2039455 RepID=UPI003B21B976
MRTALIAAGSAVAAAAAVVAVPAAAQATTTPTCRTSQLSAALGGQEAGAGNIYQHLVLTNKSSTACALKGYPGVSLLDAAGKQLGPTATREAKGYGTVTLAPGATASNTLHTLNRHGKCLPASAQVRVYPPANRASLVIPGEITICGNVFSISPLAAGAGGNPGGTGGGSGGTGGTGGSDTGGGTGGSGGSGSGGGTGGGSGSGGQVGTVPSGAPDTGVRAAAESSGNGGSGEVLVAAIGSGLAALAGAAVLVARRRAKD